MAKGKAKAKAQIKAEAKKAQADKRAAFLAAAESRKANPRDLHPPTREEALEILTQMEQTTASDGSTRYLLTEEALRSLLRFNA